MKKAFVLFAGLASLVISQPAAASWSSWNAPANQSIPAPVELSSSGLASPTATEVQINRPVTPAEFSFAGTSREANIVSPPMMAEVMPSNKESFTPIAPPTSVNPAFPPPQATSVSQSAQPIPSDLGVQFGLSNEPPQTLPAPSLMPSPPVDTKPFTTEPPSELKTEPEIQTKSKTPDFTLKDVFAGDSDSLAAIAIGSAEGTRTPEGKYSSGYYGHTDPGNGVWNLGTFSFQHDASSPEEADKKQLNRLKKQAQVMQEKATARGLKLTLEETLNGIDLANQAPKAVIDTEGYIEWLAKAREMEMNEADAILWARVQSFIDPVTQKWNAPGLGNNANQITRDQQRRMDAIANAIRVQNYQISADARLRPQPIGFFFPKALGIVQQLAQTAASWFGR